MDTTTEQIPLHIPKYETEPIQFNTPTSNISEDVADIQNFIREKAKKNLERCKSFEVSLPLSITGITDASNRIEFKSLFQTPTLNDLEIVSTNRDGSSIKLNPNQLRSVQQTGEFEVNSLHFPGQKHRWRLSKLLQSGIQTANETFFTELSWAVYMLIIYARDRVLSDRFSFKSTIRSWKQSFLNLLDILIGLSENTVSNIDPQIENQWQKFLVMNLSPNDNENEIHKNFCEQVPILIEMMHQYNARTNTKTPPKMLPYAQHFITPDQLAIDLRLYDRNLQKKIFPIISNHVSNAVSKNWFHTTKRKLINEYKQRQDQLGLSKDEIAQRIQTDLNDQYTARVFEIIENFDELEQLSSGLGHLLVQQARAVLTMKSSVQKLNEDLNEHLQFIRNELTRQYPIRSKITQWMERQISREKFDYISKHQWNAYELSIDQLQKSGNHQAAYFLQRDLVFRRDHEINLRENLKPSSQPNRTIVCRRSIWFPKNWIVERTYPLPIQRIPTYFSDRTYSHSEEEEQQRTSILRSNSNAQYELRKHMLYSVTTEYPFWRWKLFALRTYCWLSNAIYIFCMVIPFVSSVSFRALFSPNAYMYDYYLKREDLRLYENSNSEIQTFISRLMRLWTNIRESRQLFEQTPDRGFLGKNIQRLFNQVWNYIAKGFVGTVAICTVYPVLCLSLSTSSFLIGILSPIWMPVLTIIYHIGQILIFDADSAGRYTGKFFTLINIIVRDFLGLGILQPLGVLISLLLSPIISLLISIYASLHRRTRGLYDMIIYHLLIKRLARIPSQNTFLARRISGPGLASEYFYQVSSIEVLAALESLIEQNQLEIYRDFVKDMLYKPIEDYREFFNSVFQPFSGEIQIENDLSVFGQMNQYVNEKLRQLQEMIQNRQHLLEVHRSAKHDRIRLTETDLTAVLIEGTQLIEKWYPTQILPYIKQNKRDRFWNQYDLEPNDWFGLTNKLLQSLFCREILTPLEQTDAFYSLQIDHLTLNKYATMIHSANLHDDLEIVTNIYLPETSYTIQQPTFDQKLFDPIEYQPTHGSVNHRSKRSRQMDTTSFYLPNEIRLPHLILINLIINNTNATTTTVLQDISLDRIAKLIEYNQKFYHDSE